MPTQTPSLNIKGRDGGWEGTEIQLYTCSECGAQVSNAGQHSSWHDGITSAFQQLTNAINQEAQTRNQNDQTLNNGINNLAQRVAALEARP